VEVRCRYNEQEVAVVHNERLLQFRCLSAILYNLYYVHPIHRLIDSKLNYAYLMKITCFQIEFEAKPQYVMYIGRIICLNPLDLEDILS
jgi:hypothetical protein